MIPDKGSHIWAVILIIIIIIIIFLLICWGICSRMCEKDDFYMAGSTWHGPGHYNVVNVNRTEDQDCKCKPDRVDGKLKIVCVKRGLLTTNFKWRTLDCKGNVTATGTKKLQGAANLSGKVYLTEAGQAAYAIMEPLPNGKILLILNELATSRFNGKATMRFELEENDYCKW